MIPDAAAPSKVAAYTADPWESACPVLRITGPCEAAGLVVLRGTRWVGNAMLSEPTLVNEADVVVIQREFPRFWGQYTAVVARARARGVPVIYDLDDLLFGLPQTHPDWRHFQDARAPMLRALLEADAVTASTPALCSALSAYRDNVHLLPNLLNDRLWPLSDDMPALSEDPVVIGYMGGHTHQADVALIGSALRGVSERLGNQVIIRFMGRTPPPADITGLPNVVWDRTSLLDYSAFARWFASQRLDIGLAPLEDTSFNRGKSGVKFLEYTAIGAASLCSRVPAYEDTVEDGEGWLVGPAEWDEALVRLASDGALRHGLAAAARAGVRRRWLLSSRASEWTQFYASVRTGSVDGARAKLAVALDTLLELHVLQQEEALRRLESELVQMRESVTWRGTEPIRRALARWQRLTGSGRESPAAPGDGEGSKQRPIRNAPTVLDSADLDSQVAFQPQRFFWTESRFAALPALEATPTTDVIVCLGPNTHLAERCLAAVRRHTEPEGYRLRLVVHREDAVGLSESIRAGADIIQHEMTQFNFARANNLALASCTGDVVLLNDDTEVTPGWLQRLRYDARGFGLTAARTGFQCSGNRDLWGEGDSRLTWRPINMFCAFIPERVRRVVGQLDEGFSYYGGEDVDYSCRTLRNGFPLVVSSAFVHHAGTQSFGANKDRLMRESDKIILERYGLQPPFDLAPVKPLASIILVTHNRAAQLKAATRSLLTGLYPEIEIVIVDDASTDETPNTTARLQEADPRVAVIRLARPVGPAQARKLGMAAARGEFVALMDDNGVARANRVLSPLQYFMRHPVLDAVYCAFDIESSESRQRGRMQRFDLEAYRNTEFDINSGTLLMRRRTAEAVPFMTEYEAADAFDWVFRVVRQGYRIECCPSVVLDAARIEPGEAVISRNEAAARARVEILERERLMCDLGRQ